MGISVVPLKMPMLQPEYFEGTKQILHGAIKFILLSWGLRLGESRHWLVVMMVPCPSI